VNEDPGARVKSPAPIALAEGLVVALANHSALIRRDGSVRPIADSAAPIRDAAGHIVGAVLVLRDQTEARRTELALKRSRAELLALVEKLPLGVFVIDHDQIAYANPTFAEYCGVSPQAAAGPPDRGTLGGRHPRRTE
jgi:PAS domain-containing protein